MKQVFAIFCAVILMPGLNAHAWVGGPWSNNNSSPNGDDGVYEAVATTTNGMGIYRWGVFNQHLAFNNNSQNSTNIWFYRGITYFGQSFGIVNSALGLVNVIGNGSTNNTRTTSTLNPNTGVVGAGTVGLVGLPPSNGNVGFCNSSFKAKITAKAPVTRFKGSGIVSFTGAPDTELTTTSLTFTTVPSGTTVVETTRSTGGQSSDFPERGKSVKFKVIGSKASSFQGAGNNF